ncbi:peptidoglycan DD-metalloendopeptidase family protein [Acuticoccus mangrovi]|uniref:Peptidoglycan DD-metalloendopeptidase family protein n=1 Tax=Acuticoccus mangrovi TaxID=2796142 RepID=A0A934IPV0_9HYPH|nr:peptidoglycan DD-metalloendopeptidase family protein [Acuticoccus mangrovi]MBJ3776525.1 peptidoglycan DD-metalloendopeptidase family protein [Acuticoccus mangrovi]
MRIGGQPLFAGSTAQPANGAIESTDLQPIAGQTPAGGVISTPSSLRDRGWSVEGAPIVEVSSSDTAATLSQGFGVPVSVILEANSLTSADQVRPGQRLVIPTYVYRDTPAGYTDPTTSEDPTQKGATPAAPTVVAAGPGTPPTTLNQQAANLSTASRHVVQPGDTLYSIARMYRVPTEAVAKLNNLPPDGTVKVGTTLAIPDAAKLAGNTQVAALPPEQTPSGVMTDANPPLDEKKAVEKAAPPNVAATTPPAGANGAASDGADGFRWPVRGRIIAGFGRQSDGARNEGINLAVPAGTPVHAAEAGTVIYAGNELEGYGNLILVQHKDGWVSAYAHNESLKVSRGDQVKRGQMIASVGKSGSVDQPQLHFELRKNSKPVDPLPHLSGA